VTTGTLITEEVKSCVGRKADPMTYEVEPSGVRAFARAVGCTDLVHYNEQVASAKGRRGLVAPFGYLGTPVYNPTSRPINPLRMPELPVKRRLNGGTQLTYLQDVCAGDVLKVTHGIKNIYERPGRSGPMAMIVIETTFENETGDLVARQEMTLIRY
jgi:hypothetical protein